MSNDRSITVCGGTVIVMTQPLARLSSQGGPSWGNWVLLCGVCALWDCRAAKMMFKVYVLTLPPFFWGKWWYAELGNVSQPFFFFLGDDGHPDGEEHQAVYPQGEKLGLCKGLLCASVSVLSPQARSPEPHPW